MRHPIPTLAATFAMCVGLSSTLALGATYYVPGDSPTIQGALDMTVPGDSVIVSAGTYHENLTMKEIGEILKLSESRVCQLHSRLLDRLKDKYSNEF